MNHRILLLGNPNSGKTLLFNRLTGLHHKVANFPGVTVSVAAGKAHFDPDTQVVDFPGVYSLQPLTRDEEVAIEKFKALAQSDSNATLLCLLDGTRLERSLVLGLQLLEFSRSQGLPLVFAVTMSDELRANKTTVRAPELSEKLGVPVQLVSSRTREGIPELESMLKRVSKEPRPTARTPDSSVIEVEKFRDRARALALEFGPVGDVLLVRQTKLDRFFLSGFGGGFIFLLIMALLFQSIFSWASPLMDFIDQGVSGLGTWTAAQLPPGIFADFIKDAVFGGLGAFLVFAPQIFVLTLLIGILEDTGYLARAAVVCHRPLSAVGLSGKSFVPLLSGFACAIPAIMSARMIESPRRRWMTLFVIPLMSCSARLPVYALLIAAIIPDRKWLGVLGFQGLTLFAIYLFGIVFALVLSGLLKLGHAFQSHSDAPFVLELPPYRLPDWKPLLRSSFQRALSFVTNAGGVIFAVTVVVWFLGYFPNGAGHLEGSYLGQLGHWIQPALSPLGLDWKFGVAILASFVAREVFVGTLGTLYGIENATDEVSGLAHQLQAAQLTIPTGLALIVFYAIALQCASTLAVLKRETGSWRMPVTAFALFSVLAYFFGFLTHWAGTLLALS